MLQLEGAGVEASWHSRWIAGGGVVQLDGPCNAHGRACPGGALLCTSCSPRCCCKAALKMCRTIAADAISKAQPKQGLMATAACTLDGLGPRFSTAYPSCCLQDVQPAVPAVQVTHARNVPPHGASHVHKPGPPSLVPSPVVYRTHTPNVLLHTFR